MALTLFAGCSSGGKNAADSELSGLGAGDVIFFGSYPQSASEPEPIEWRVLEAKDDRVLVISEKILDCRPYNGKEQKETVYADCSLRKWLNGGFMNKAFSSGEKERILKVTNANTAPPEEGDTGALFAEGGEDTEDSVFCLSYDEVVRYFPDEGGTLAEPTDFAVSKGVFTLDTGVRYGQWWLRTQGYDNKWAMYAKPIGIIDTDGSGVWNDDIGVRPAMWIRCG